MSIEEKAKRVAANILIYINGQIDMGNREYPVSRVSHIRDEALPQFEEFILKEFSQPDVREKPQGLRLEWVDGRAECDKWELRVWQHDSDSNDWWWVMKLHNQTVGTNLLQSSPTPGTSKLSAQLAAESALESISLSLREKFGAREIAKKEPTQFEHEQIAKTVESIVELIAFRDKQQMTASEIVSANHLIRDMIWECYARLVGEATPDAAIEALAKEMYDLSKEFVWPQTSLEEFESRIRKRLKGEKK